MKTNLEFETWAERDPEGRKRLEAWRNTAAMVKWGLVGVSVALALMATFLV